MEAFLISVISIASAEIGDRTQLLALLLSSRFSKRGPIILGILAATLLNHSISALLGEWLSKHLTDGILYGVLAISFFAAAIWVLIPDKIDPEQKENSYFSSIFLTVFITFFIAEIGDKTQIVTGLLAARYQTLIPVVLGTTTGMLIADIPVVFLGQRAVQFVSMRILKGVSFIIFLAFGIFELIKLF